MFYFPKWLLSLALKKGEMLLKIGTRNIQTIGSIDYSDMISSFVIFITL